MYVNISLNPFQQYFFFQFSSHSIGLEISRAKIHYSPHCVRVLLNLIKMEKSMQFYATRNPQPEFAKIQIFESAQQYFAILGIIPALEAKSYPISWKVLMPFFAIMTSTIGVGVYVFNDAQSFIEHIQSTFMWCIGIALNFVLMIIVIKVDKLFEFIDRCDIIVNTSM